MDKETVTIFAYKSGGSYIHHGVRFPEGGCFATNDSGWSLDRAIRYEEQRLSLGTKYRIEKSGKLFENLFVKS